MICLIWNVRGINNKVKQLDIGKYLQDHRAPLIALLEHKLSSSTVELAKTRIFGRQSSVFSHSHDGGGRIWLLWRKDEVQVDVLRGTDQFMRCSAKMKVTSKRFHFTIVYGSNSSAERFLLWDALQSLALNTSGPWFVGGDFNEVRYGTEKRGGRPLQTSRAIRFNNCLDNCHLFDLHALGNTFSWNNRQENRISCRLDRILGNSDWFRSYPEAYTQYLPGQLSDQSALKMVVEPPLQSYPKPFKFFHAWLQHETFMGTLQAAWGISVSGTAMFRLAKKLQHTKSVLKEWNRVQFGRVQDMVSSSRHTLQQIQLGLQNDPLHQSLMLAEKEERRWYEEALAREQEIMSQKARTGWLQEGDKSSKFFYAQFAARKSHNTLRKVVLTDGSVISDQRQVQDYTVEFYRDLLNKESYIPVPELLSTRKLSYEDNHTLCAEVTEKEIFQNLSHMKKDGSPGPDGFTSGFFQTCWDIVKEDLVLAIKEFFDRGTLLQQLNNSFIALIPKNSQACSLDQFRSISLCGTVYKLVTKILASRLQLVLPALISLNQTAFIKGRKIAHGILLEHKMVKYLAPNSGKGRAVAKLDLRKAFDSIRWPYLRRVLEAMNFNS
ncbi:hypothetical protein QJS04_geneDACA021350 [Acorus gramineus]|uniref:Reverse transcriptase domain-containing protein n=1 Tax=Acorus gramineus TaxID=55184 RepID=A0AAV9BSQ3_ACOGR|nr:hypothetical protein QJS04_geneDACA021350 [Acorus gramineus]